MPSGSNAWISAYLAQTRSRVGVYLTFSKGPIGDRIFERLKEDSNSINQALGVPGVVWESDGKKHWISSRQSFSGILIEEHREEVRAWLSDRVNRFVTVFRPRIERLLRE